MEARLSNKLKPYQVLTMNKKVELILKKHKSDKAITSKGVGTLLLASTINSIRRASDPNIKPLVTQEEFNAIRNKLTASDFESYRAYNFVCNGLINAHTHIQSLIQQFHHGYYRIKHYLETAYVMERDEKQRFTLPYILSEEEEKRLHAEIIEKTANQKYDYVDIFTNVVQNPPGYIKPLIDKLKEEHEHSNRINSNYGEIAGYGYYVLNGKPGKYTGKEIEGIVSEFSKTNSENIITTAKELLYQGYDFIKDSYEKATGKKVTETESEIIECLEKLYIAKGGIIFTKIDQPPICDTPPDCLKYLIKPNLDLQWLPYKSVPDEISRFDVLIDKRFYEAIADIEEDYPELYNTVSTHISEQYPTIRPDKEYTKKELVQISFFNSSVLTPPALDKATLVSHIIDKGDILLGTRILLHGILTPYDSTQKSLFNRDGTYRDFALECHNEKRSIYSVLNYNEATIQSLNDFIYRLCTPAINDIIAYNKLLEILANVFNLSDFNLLRVDTSSMESLANVYNNLLFSLYALPTYSPTEETIMKREIIKKAFPLIKIRRFLPEAVTDEVKNTIKTTFHNNPVQLENLSSFLKLL